nr:leucine-rich repeat-containing protein 70-like [Onthophagus taurus]
MIKNISHKIILIGLLLQLVTNTTNTKLTIETLAKNLFKDNNVNKVQLSNNSISELSPFQFTSIPNNTHIYLQQNDITYIPRDVFTNNERIYYISLASNEISNMERFAFALMPLLTLLNLSSNKITAIDKDWFTGSRNIRDLYLENNLIREINKDAFSEIHNLKVINLSFNRIYTIKPGSFDGVKSMVGLSGNFLADLSFINSTKLDWISVSFNKINHLDLNYITEIKAIYAMPNPLYCKSLINFLRGAPKRGIRVVHPRIWNPSCPICIKEGVYADDVVNNIYYKMIETEFDFKYFKQELSWLKNVRQINYSYFNY